jgi:hypothetical protein
VLREHKNIGSKLEPSKIEEKGEVWQTQKRMKIAAQRRDQEPGRTRNVFDENPFSPLGGTSEEVQGETKEERPPPIFIKNLTNINTLLM